MNCSKCEWLKINKLSLNVKKTPFIIFHNKQKKIDIVPKINIDKNQIDQVRSNKFLEVLINENLTWSDHMSAVLNKTSKMLVSFANLVRHSPVIF